MDFVTSHFGKMNLWPLLQHICRHLWAWTLNTIAITPKSEDKYVVKVFNLSEFHLPETTCYKIHTLVQTNWWMQPHFVNTVSTVLDTLELTFVLICEWFCLIISCDTNVPFARKLIYDVLIDGQASCPILN